MLKRGVVRNATTGKQLGKLLAELLVIT